MKVYHVEYLQGIKDGRAALKIEGKDRLKETAKAELEFCDRVSKCMGSSYAKEYISGLRDFWNHQLKIQATTPHNRGGEQ